MILIQIKKYYVIEGNINIYKYYNYKIFCNHITYIIISCDETSK